MALFYARGSTVSRLNKEVLRGTTILASYSTLQASYAF